MHSFAVWSCGVLAGLAISWGLAVLITGRAPRREVRRFHSVPDYGYHCIGLGVALGLLGLGAAVGGWGLLLTLAGFGILAWLNVRLFRSRRTT
ncbi:hypothetical protein GCM10023176_21770 [Micromonospora coerulea]|uniref:Uncharacterized protein n=1 Tax=Micromonospora coerulea TaxID=47856 RepID=A0ABP8SGI6_9ACTN